MEDSIREAVQLIREKYVDSENSERVARNIEEYLASPVAKVRMEELNIILWELNAILTSTTHDMHFSFQSTSAPSGVPAGIGIPIYNRHYIRFIKMDDIRDEPTRQQYINIFKQFEDPLVIDLRNCSGGALDTIYYLLCHFFPDGTPLFEYITRDTPSKVLKAASTATWFDKNNEIKKFTGRVKVLVNGYSMSGAEIFAKVMQSHGRAKIYGTQTPGAFYATTYFGFARIGLNLPFAKLVDPTTKLNSDGVGVTPDFIPMTKEYISLIFNDIIDNNFSSF
jgi:hypothetical protein